MEVEVVNETMAREAIRVLLRYIGEDPTRDGLEDTPDRVIRAWDEMTEGYSQNPKDLLATDFASERYNQIIACPWIEFHSTCEHHLLPFVGYAHVAYLPNQKKARVVGLSKMARLVDCFARRLQIQEKLTVQVADAMSKYLSPAGVAVVIQAKHECMACRGVRKQQAVMVTSQMRGVFLKHAEARAEFFKLVELADKCNQ